MAGKFVTLMIISQPAAKVSTLRFKRRTLGILGVLLVVRAGWVWGFFGVLFAFYFPSLMAFSSAEWFWLVPGLDWETKLNSAAMATLFGLFVAGHMATRYATQFKRSGMQLLSQGFDVAYVERFWTGKMIFAGLVLAGAALIVGAAVGLDRLVGGHIGGSSFKPVLFGIGGSAVLIGAVYHLLLRRRAV